MPRMLVPVLLICFFAGTVEASDPPKVTKPDFNFDYQVHLQSFMQLMADGKSDQAIDLLESHAPEKYSAENREGLKRSMAQVFGSMGKSLEIEVLGYKRLTSRACRLYGVTHYEKATMTYTLLYVKNKDGRWEMQNYGFTSSLEELDKLTPLTPLEPAH